MERLQEELEKATRAQEEEEARLKREAEDAFAIIGDLDSALKVSMVYNMRSGFSCENHCMLCGKV